MSFNEIDDLVLRELMHLGAQVEQPLAFPEPIVTVTERLVRGGDFGLDAATNIPAIWGAGDNVLAAAGETTLFVGPTGVGKTTMAQRFTRARAGLDNGHLLGFPVAPEAKRVLYIAADRPRQAQRSWARMTHDSEREALNERVVFWKGPLPFDLNQIPERLADWAIELNAGTIIGDSLKDLFLDLTKDEVGSRVARCLQHVAAANLEAAFCHHQRKGTGDRKPKLIEDVYGSTWITAAAGSVLCLWGKPGDPIVELTHLKQPAGEVGPLELTHNATTGTVEVAEGHTPLEILRSASRGLTAAELARATYGVTEPDRSQTEKARRSLEKLTDAGQAVRQPGTHQTDPVRYFATTRRNVP